MQRKFRVKSQVTSIVGDTLTPVSVYLKLRDVFPGSVLLECSDYESSKNCFSFICFDELSHFTVSEDDLLVSYPDASEVSSKIKKTETVKLLADYLSSFAVEQAKEYSFIANGLFGYSGYDAVCHFEDINFRVHQGDALKIPDLYYRFFRYILAINHEKDQYFLLENTLSEAVKPEKSIQDIKNILANTVISKTEFKQQGLERSNLSDTEHGELIEKCKEHIFRGDVFQIVPSRRFEQDFVGDDFQVYRALRMINPSPYLFYFDCHDFRIFGSSPEAELIVKDGKASIHPIAGTCPRVEDEIQNLELIEKLLKDPKENSEHVMLVDLARNDLSRNCYDVKVESYREVQKYSHVIHLVSRVIGTINQGQNVVMLLADTFPAGTLSGAPKYRAMELLDRYEKGRRRFYGGAIGCLGFDESCNHAIIIRSFLSKAHTLYRQAGGGVVAESVIASEVQEVKNKLGALKKALALAEEI